MPLVITGTVGNQTWADPVANFDAAAGRYWADDVSAGPAMRTQDVQAAGVAGQTTRRSGLEGRELRYRVWYVSADVPACNTDYAADFAALQNQPLSIAAPGETIPACELLPWEIIEPAVLTGYGTAMMKVQLNFRQKRSQ